VSVYYHYSAKCSRHLCNSLPPYLSQLITHYLPPRALCSSNYNTLARPYSITSDFSSRAFCFRTINLNSLPAHIRSLDKLSTFKPPLKTHIFQSALAVLSPYASASDSLFLFWHYINLYVYMFVCMTSSVQWSSFWTQRTSYNVKSNQ